MSFTAGQRLRASQLNELGTVIGRAVRTTNSSATTGTAVSLLRLDDIPILAGRLYKVGMVGGLFPVSTNSGRGDIFLRYTTNGSTPTTASTVLLQRGCQLFTSQFVEPYESNIYYAPGASNQTLSLHLSFASVGGVNIQSYGATTWPTLITITDVGADPGNTGTVL